MSTATAAELPRVSLAPNEGGRRTARTWLRRLIVYPAFFLLCFVTSAYWTFPYDRVRDILVAKASDGTSRLDIAELSPSWLTGIEASGITYTTYPTRPDERVSAIEIPEATARISLLTRDEAGYREDLRVAEAWVRRYFDARAKATRDYLGQLGQLSGASLNLEVPSIGESLEAVRSFKARRER